MKIKAVFLIKYKHLFNLIKYIYFYKHQKNHIKINSKQLIKFFTLNDFWSEFTDNIILNKRIGFNLNRFDLLLFWLEKLYNKLNLLLVVCIPKILNFNINVGYKT